ncbi:MAG: hypothetical protein ACQGTM_09060 [bacterium]
MKLVYICSPYAGDVENNVRFAKAACRYAMKQGCAPIAVHLLYPQILNDAVPSERKAGIRMGLRVLASCEELWANVKRLVMESKTGKPDVITGFPAEKLNIIICKSHILSKIFEPME